jgi:hypothetical protein
MAENKVVMHRALLRRADVRELYLLIQRATPGNRTGERWLQAADQRLYDLSGVTYRAGGTYHLERLESPEEILEIEMSDDAVKGVKLAVVQHLLGDATRSRPVADYSQRKATLDFVKGFGRKFVALVEKEARLPESNDLDEEEPLDLAESETEKE